MPPVTNDVTKKFVLALYFFDSREFHNMAVLSISCKLDRETSLARGVRIFSITNDESAVHGKNVEQIYFCAVLCSTVFTDFDKTRTP